MKVRLDERLEGGYMKSIAKMSERELRSELAEARVALISFDAASSTDAFENIGHYNTARHALERWKQVARFRAQDE